MRTVYHLLIVWLVIGCFFFLNVMRSSQCFSNLISEWKLRVSTNASLVPSLRTVIFIPRFARQKISPCSLTNSACANPNFSFTYQITAYCGWCSFPYFYLTLSLTHVGSLVGYPKTLTEESWFRYWMFVI